MARVGAGFEIFRGQLGRNRRREFAERLAMLDEDVQIFGRIRIERRRQNAAIAQRARAEFHAALHPRDDLVLAQHAHGRRQQFVGGAQVLKAQLAVFEHLFDLLGAVAGAEQQRTVAGGAMCRCTWCHT